MRDPLQRCIQPITSTQKAQLNSKRREGLRFLHRASPSFQPVVYLSLDTLVLAKGSLVALRMQATGGRERATLAKSYCLDDKASRNPELRSSTRSRESCETLSWSTFWQHQTLQNITVRYKSYVYISCTARYFKPLVSAISLHFDYILFWHLRATEFRKDYKNVISDRVHGSWMPSTP